MAELQNVGLSNLEFGVDIYQKLSTTAPDSNVFFSPISILFALAMTLLGAKEKTEAELKTVLKLDRFSNDRIHPLLGEFINHLQDTKGSYELRIANKLYAEQTFNFLTSFTDECKKHYGAGLEAVDFINKASECEALINRWVESQTNDKIKDLLPAGSLDRNTRLVLINAVYFKGLWHQQFSEDKTKEGDFFEQADRSVKVTFMHFEEEELKYQFHEELKSQILELPYVNKTLSFIVILPDLSKTDMSSVENKLSGDLLSKISHNLRKREVNVSLPKFKLESKPDVLSSLKKLGLNELFDISLADLSKMNGVKNLYVSDLVHKAYIEVNEKGSEAAASTGVIVRPMSRRPEPIVFNANHPFLFLIKDNISGAVLFMGKLIKP